MNPKISLIIITARMNYPYTGRPDLHLFEPLIESLKSQTMAMSDFELIVVDQLYDERKDYFKDYSENNNLPFKVKHIPAHPNIWHDVKLPGVCTQFNKGIIYADGELLFFFGDGCMVVPEFCERLWNYYKQGYIPLVWYFFDNSFDPQTTTEPDILQMTYNISGYTGKDMVYGHRPLLAFKGNNKQIHLSKWEWWFGCSSAPLEAMLKINGFDQRFDGDRMLLDCDVGSRLQLAGFNNFALFRNLFLIRAKTDNNVWNVKLPKDGVPSIKCNSPLLWWSRNYYKFRANEHEIIDGDIEWAKNYFCRLKCSIRELCKTQHPWQYPFEHKAGYGLSSEKKWFDYWRTHQVNINLTTERQKRLSGDEKYKEGTFI